MTGQEERDMLFARLFGFTAIIQSGLLVQTRPLPTSASSDTLPSTLASYQELVDQLLALGEKKSWFRESVWWTLGLAIDALHGSNVPWKKTATDYTIDSILSKSWSPEKIALVVKLERLYPARDWQPLLSPVFKSSDLLNTSNMPALARILKVIRSFSVDCADRHQYRIRRSMMVSLKTPLQLVRAIGNLSYTLFGTLCWIHSCPPQELKSSQHLFQNFSVSSWMVSMNAGFSNSLIFFPLRISICVNSVSRAQVLGISSLPKGIAPCDRINDAYALYKEFYAYLDKPSFETRPILTQNSHSNCKFDAYLRACMLTTAGKRNSRFRSEKSAAGFLADPPANWP